MRRDLRSYDLRTSESHILGTNYRASLRFYDLLILRCIITYNFSLNIAGLVARSQLPRPLLSLSHTLRVRAAVAATADALAHAPAVATCCGCSCSCGRSCTRALLHTFQPPRPVVVALAHVPAVATCCGRSHTPPLLLTLALAVAAAAAVVALARQVAAAAAAVTLMRPAAAAAVCSCYASAVDLARALLPIALRSRARNDHLFRCSRPRARCGRRCRCRCGSSRTRSCPVLYLTCRPLGLATQRPKFTSRF